MTPAGRAARTALARHDLAHAENDVYERVADVAVLALVAPEQIVADDVAALLDREGLAVEQAPETLAAARDVVAAVREVVT